MSDHTDRLAAAIALNTQSIDILISITKDKAGTEEKLAKAHADLASVQADLSRTNEALDAALQQLEQKNTEAGAAIAAAQPAPAPVAG